MFSLPLSTVWNRNRVTDLSPGIMAFNFGNLMTLDIRNINALLLGHGATFSGRSLLAVSSGNISALLLLNSVTNCLRNISTVLLGHLTTLLLGDITTFLLRDVVALLLVSNLLTFLLVDSLTFLLVTGITFLLIRSIALTTVLSLEIIKYNNKSIKRIKHLLPCIRPLEPCDTFYHEQHYNPSGENLHKPHRQHPCIPSYR